MSCMPERALPKIAKFWVALTAAVLLSTSVWAASSASGPSAVPLSPPRSVPAWIQLAQGRGSQSMDQNLREWQTLSPEEKQQMRRRMQQLNRMEPEDRRHFQRLFEKWQQLSPAERRQIERALDRWDRLSPDEREAVRQRFRG